MHSFSGVSNRRLGGWFLITLCLLAVFECGMAQRSAVSLGSRLNKWKKSRADKVAGDFVVEGEDDDFGDASYYYAAVATVAVILWTSSYLRSRSASSKGEDDGESSRTWRQPRVCFPGSRSQDYCYLYPHIFCSF